MTIPPSAPLTMSAIRGRFAPAAGVLLAAVLLTAGCGAGDGNGGRAGGGGPTVTVSDSPTPSPADGVRSDTLVPDGYRGELRGAGTVLENEEHGPELCSLVAESLPPRCGGVELNGWDWDALAASEYETRSGVRWGGFTVTGTWDASRRRLDLTQEPQPESVGNGMEEEPAKRVTKLTEAELESVRKKVEKEVFEAGEGYVTLSAEPERGQVVLETGVATESEQDALDRRFGPGVVRLAGFLVPVHSDAAQAQ